MTNLTSEQYRDVLKHIPDCTEEIPSIQHLLRRAVETFFNRFGAYPELAGVAPGKIGIFGDQTQFDDGMALPAATPMATIIVGRKAPGPRFTVVTSADVGKPHKIKFSFSRKRPLAPGCPAWLNHVKGIIDNYEVEVPPFEAAIESSLPMGVGFGSSSAIQVATYSFLEILVGKKTEPVEKAKACQKAEKEFMGHNVGLVDRMTAVLAKDRHALLIDCQTNEVQNIPINNKETAFVAVDLHLKDTLLGDEYSERGKYLKKACEMLGVKTLKNCTLDDLSELENKMNEVLVSKSANEKEGEEEEDADEEEEKDADDEEEEEQEGEQEQEEWTKEEYDIMIKRARFFITEMVRIREAVEAWEEGEVEKFGEKMKESHNALKEDFDFNNPALDFVVNTSLEVEGVMGAKMTGMGLNSGGGVITVMDRKYIGKYCEYVKGKFAELEGKLTEEMQDIKTKKREKQRELKMKEEMENKRQEEISSAGVASPEKRLSVEISHTCREKRQGPCIIKVERKPGGCGTWRKERQKEKTEKIPEETEATEEEKPTDTTTESQRKDSNNTKDSVVKTPSEMSQISEVKLLPPSFYVVTPFAGARMMFVTKTDILRSLYAKQLPQPKALVRKALEVFKMHYGQKPEAVGLAPATVTLFGEFMEFHLGYIICMALPMMTATAGGRNDTVTFSLKTTLTEVEPPPEMKFPLPCVRRLEKNDRSWVNFILGTINEFKGFVPGFNAVINSSVPIQIGVNSCAALQASIYTFLESLTRECTEDPFEKADRCGRSEYEFLPTPTELVTKCSSIKFFPTFLSQEGKVMLINCRRYTISHYFFDHPSYVFLIATVKENTTNVTVESLEDRLLQCKEALEILNRNSLLTADLKHLRCLKKRDASEEAIKRTKYVITEHQRTIEAVKAIKEEDYPRVGLLLNQSHDSLRDDYEVSSPQIEKLIDLAKKSEVALGAKMLGKGLNASIIILLKITDADKCIRYMKKNYTPKYDKPVFYITKPSRGSFRMDPESEVPLIP